jgi:hypothetical protein
MGATNQSPLSECCSSREAVELRKGLSNFNFVPMARYLLKLSFWKIFVVVPTSETVPTAVDISGCPILPEIHGRFPITIQISKSLSMAFCIFPSNPEPELKLRELFTSAFCTLI